MSLPFTNWPDDLDRSEIERQDTTIEPSAGRVAVEATDIEPADDTADALRPEQTLATEASSRARASVVAEDSSISRDLVGLYFRQMGRVELLSRADEVALAKRIEAGQRALVEGLSQVPMLVDRIRLWVDEVRRGTRDARRLVEPSGADHGPADATDSAGPEAEGPSGDAGRDGGLPAEMVARLEDISALAGEITFLSRERMAALAGGSNLARRDRTRLVQLLGRIGRAIGLLRLHPDRIGELVAALEDEHRQLDRIERETEALADTGGIAATPKELSVLALRLGLPIAEFRKVAARISQARRDIKTAREEIVRAHLPLVVAIAKRYRGKSSLDLLDLIQEGNLGLMHAVEKYDHRRGVKVATYAVWWIRQAITRAIADQGRLIRVPVHMTESVTKVLRERRRLSHRLGRDPQSDEIAARVAMPANRVERAMSLAREPVSLDAPVGADGDATLGDLIEAQDAADPHAVAEESALKQSIAEALSGLTEREQRILRMRFGIGGTEEKTLAEVGEVFGVTRERIRQIEAAALAKLRQTGRGRKLLSFVQA